MKMKKLVPTIKEAFAVYTGGGIWLFHGTTTDGNWFLTDDYGATLILKTDPAAHWDESLFEEWQQKNKVAELADDNRLEFCDKLCDVLLQSDVEHQGGITILEIERYREWFRLEY